MGQTGSLTSDALEEVVNERVHDAHSLVRDTSVGVDLLQNLVDVDAIGFLAPLLVLLLGTISIEPSSFRRSSSSSRLGRLGSATGSGGRFSGHFRWHDDDRDIIMVVRRTTPKMQMISNAYIASVFIQKCALESWIEATGALFY